MKRRKFITASASLSAIGFLPEQLLGYPLFSDAIDFPEPYDDHKVVRVYDRKVSDYDFSGEKVYWKTIDPDVLGQMLSRSIAEISGEGGEKKSWEKILAGSTKADLSEKKVVVKVNFNNTIRDINATLNNSPAMLVVLSRSLLKAGLKEENICFFDCSRPFPKEFIEEVRSSDLKNIRLLGTNDELPVSNHTIFLSDNAGIPRDGKATDRYPIPQILIDADYLINLHLVKIHMTGVTGAMKNLFGIAKNVGFYMHYNATKEFTIGNHLPDISLSPEIKDRVRLNIGEFIFGGHTPDTIDRFTNDEFFPNGIPGSLIVSRSPFYHDTVLYSFIKAEYETCVPVLKRFKEIGPDTWLKNSSEKYSAWKYEKCKYVQRNKKEKPIMDLSFSEINYISV